ncbi:HD domain-containing protein [Candidatus Woesearchaeota archaeon]|nr:HD domain-containing protein [Candidatus Woesearchaeota archaeon]
MIDRTYIQQRYDSMEVPSERVMLAMQKSAAYFTAAIISTGTSLAHYPQEFENEMRFLKSTFDHQCRVYENLQEISTHIEQEGHVLDDILFAAAMHHDIGRFRQKPIGWHGSDGEWRSEANANHPKYSAELVGLLLANNGFDTEELSEISSIIAKHSSYDSNATPNQKYLMLADAVDKFSGYAPQRLDTNRLGRIKNPLERMVDIYEVMMYGFNKARSLDILVPYIDGKRKEGENKFDELCVSYDVDPKKAIKYFFEHYARPPTLMQRLKRLTRNFKSQWFRSSAVK